MSGEVNVEYVEPHEFLPAFLARMEWQARQAELNARLRRYVDGQGLFAAEERTGIEKDYGI